MTMDYKKPIKNDGMPHSDEPVGDACFSAFLRVHNPRSVTHRGRVFHQRLRTSQRHRQPDDLHTLTHRHRYSDVDLESLFS